MYDFDLYQSLDLGDSLLKSILFYKIVLEIVKTNRLGYCMDQMEFFI